MTLEEAKQTAPRVTMTGETIFIVGTPDDCQFGIAYGVGGESVERFNDLPVLSSRSWAGTDYANDQQGKWCDRE